MESQPTDISLYSEDLYNPVPHSVYSLGSRFPLCLEAVFYIHLAIQSYRAYFFKPLK